jgi:hypothetical protein
MEKFMLIFHSRRSGGDQSPEQMQEVMGKWMAWIDKLAKAGQYVSGEPLEPTGKFVSGKSKSVTDGPFTEGKELVGGYFIVNASSIDEAVRLCDDYPDFENGGRVEVRQVMKIPMPA